MPRANRHFIPGHVWHLTHRCHEHDWLLKFVCDRRRWLAWLFEARKRYGLTILNYIVTSNHIHLLVHADGDRLTIPRSMQLLAGRVAQEFNLRKQRTGAFWEDRYHATAVETGRHLRGCMTYIDLNMVRAGVVKHPADWECCGYREIQNPPLRYRCIDRGVLARLLELSTVDDVCTWQERVVRESLETQTKPPRCPEWTESIAVGDERYLHGIGAELGMIAHYRDVTLLRDGTSVLRETPRAYTTRNAPENTILSCDNSLIWDVTF